MGKRMISLLVAVLLLSGAAAASAQPAATALTGVWEGFITGRQMATANGVMAESVRLVVKDDGTWTMTTATLASVGKHNVTQPEFRPRGELHLEQSRGATWSHALLSVAVGKQPGTGG